MRKISFLILGIAVLCPFTSQSQEVATNQNTTEAEWSTARPDGHAPIGIMGDHLHKKGDWMFSYKFMPMTMSGMLEGSDEMREDALPMPYMAAPKDMNMQMHMLGVMYAPSDNITLMVMGNYVSNSMDLNRVMEMDMGMNMDRGFETESKGFGDITIGGLFRVFKANRQSVHGTLSLSIPTGDIDQRGDTPMMANSQLAYPMQLGSGTFDPSIGLTYLGQSDVLSWGSQTLYKFRTGENSEDYQLGNEFKWSSWGSIKGSNSLAFSCSINYRKVGTISGKDSDMNPMMMPLFNTDNSGREQIDLGIGSNYFVPKGKLKNLRLGLELNLPVYQKVIGIQMQNKIFGTVGIQYSLGTSCH